MSSDHNCDSNPSHSPECDALLRLVSELWEKKVDQDAYIAGLKQQRRQVESLFILISELWENKIRQDAYIATLEQQASVAQGTSYAVAIKESAARQSIAPDYTTRAKEDEKTEELEEAPMTSTSPMASHDTDDNMMPMVGKVMTDAQSVATEYATIIADDEQKKEPEKPTTTYITSIANNENNVMLASAIDNVKNTLITDDTRNDDGPVRGNATSRSRNNPLTSAVNDVMENRGSSKDKNKTQRGTVRTSAPLLVMDRKAMMMAAHISSLTLSSGRNTAATIQEEESIEGEDDEKSELPEDAPPDKQSFPDNNSDNTGTRRRIPQQAQLTVKDIMVAIQHASAPILPPHATIGNEEGRNVSPLIEEATGILRKSLHVRPTKDNTMKGIHTNSRNSIKTKMEARGSSTESVSTSITVPAAGYEKANFAGNKKATTRSLGSSADTSRGRGRFVGAAQQAPTAERYQETYDFLDF